MATNSRNTGDQMTFTAPTGGVVSGTAYLIGGLLVVANITAAQTLPFTGGTRGVYSLPKATGAAWTEGQVLYWDDTAKKITGTSSGNTKVGCAAAAAASGDTTGLVRLNGTA
jgi:predicted RecA/RadA family phage recombinase